MRTTISIAMTLMTLTVLPAASRAERRIGGSFQQITYDCRRDPTVDVGGTLSQITLVGPCTTVKVSGNLNQVTIDSTLALVVAGDENQVRAEATDAIRASGGHNEITYRRAVTPKKATQISSTGPNNVIKNEK